MKIVRTSNYDHEDNRGDQRVVAENIKHEREANVMCEALNAFVGEHSDDYFVVKPDDYILRPDWEP